ncbi:hypothetical protein AJ79_00266 [Helicocarpus griseus UAMH5409]|uniref:Uncharacterized protein n=1 Tax=Helicocarpus griseus UAMH5409 TaxID=1447875 RepID=A0A2B7YCT9_9EURO|nr:hypothetical protein AJ79_00266 [Helicocarpus griseus UAMH5409]
MALLMESVPAFEEIWIECLGDLARYRMAVETNDTQDWEVWAGVASSICLEGQPSASLPGPLGHLTKLLHFPDCSHSEKDCVFSRNIKFLERLKQHTQLAKSDKWCALLSEAELPDHVWAKENANYTLALKEQDLDEALQED